MRRSGFTMIELIFVIVILGILAAVAIPKLTATRDDAKISKGASEIATAIQDIGAYYTAKGSFSTMSDMTSVKFYTTSGGSTAADSTNLAGNTVYYNVGSTGCISFAGTSTDGNLTVADLSGSTAVCQGIADATSNLQKTHVFGGSGITY